MEQLNEQIVVVATVDPDAYGTGTQNSDVIDMALHDRVLFVVMAGTLGTNGTVDFGVYGDTASNGSFSTLITGKSITQLTEAGTDSDKQAVVEVSGDEVQAQGYRYVRGLLTIGTATSDAGVVALAGGNRYNIADDLSSVDEVVA